MKISDQPGKKAVGHMKGSVGGVAFSLSTGLTLFADDWSTDFVIQADWIENDSARQLTFYIPERGPEEKEYSIDSLASAFYELDGKAERWRDGTITRMEARFLGDPENWYVVIKFDFYVSIGDQTVNISGDGKLTGASPWGKRESDEFRKCWGIGAA
ncbi:hypothetical protein OC610_26330 [Pseudomonas sp. SAICEU22]|uniref:Uncharacterized protein n=1 Tax=Pseudomonas agronomica TaxID=2979328 RepID=A0ABT3FFV6_9PSED|nr:hypothetical protein [Pseudomonas agronomica]MCW1247961.1 hypothetical protein [Pseudomonas agronomica]